MDNQTIILLVIPIIIIQLILIIINLINIIKKDSTKYLTKPIWIIIILLLQIPGSLAYILIESGDHNASD